MTTLLHDLRAAFRALRRSPGFAAAAVLTLALGAGRARLARQFLTETLVLTLMGGIGGVLLALWSGGLFRVLGVPPLDPLVDARALGFTLGVALVTSVLAGLAPALRAAAAPVEAELKAASTRSSAERSRLRSALTVGQLALSLALLICAGLFVRSLRNAKAIHTGYDLDRVLAVSVDLGEQGHSDAETAEFNRAAAERLRRLPGVASVALTEVVPFWGYADAAITIPGWEKPLGTPEFATMEKVGPDYFRTLGLDLRAGRAFGPDDRAGSPGVAVVNETMARKYWPGGSALGKSFDAAGSDGLTVVGVVADAKFTDLQETQRAAFYLPLAQMPEGAAWSSLLVRTRGPAAPLAEPVRSALQSLDPTLPYVDAHPLADNIAIQLQPWRVAAAMFTLFGVLALVLAVVGLYGVVAYSVAQRTREVGIRVALGAGRRDVLALVVGEGARLVVVGSGVGIALALVATRLLRSRMYGVSTTDPLTYLAAVLALAGAALVAAYVPARRAMRVDPVVALRSE